MDEIVSPNQSKQRVATGLPLQSPTATPFFLGSNDDKLERAQARAARAAAIRRQFLAFNASLAPPRPDPDLHHPDPCLGKQQILELYQNCIKLASENKINQKNTWDLTLIDHLTEIIKAEEENDSETNFQKASCTLEAGVKIYSLRVDSVHSEAYKVLGGMNRVGQETEQDTIAEDVNANNGLEEGRTKKETDKKLSPLSTLESSFEALNVKKLDVAFAVDPLYHQTSAQFDEGGAKGLLLNNLSVYGGCRVLFDSFEVPGKSMQCAVQYDKPETIDLSFAREHIEQMVFNMRIKDEITPTLRSIVNQFDDDNLRPPDTFSTAKNPDDQADLPYNEDDQVNGSAFENCADWSHDQDDQTSMVGDGLNDEDSTFPSYNEESAPSTFYEPDEPDTDDRFDKVDSYLFLGLGFTSRQNAWAGPDHWKYQKTKDSDLQPVTENESAATSKRPRRKNQVELDINFTDSLDKEIPDLFAPPKNPKSLLLPANRTACNKTLPEDCHYQPENLVKLFLLPNVMCIGRRRRKTSEKLEHQGDDCSPQPSWNAEDMFGGQFDDSNDHSDVEDSISLVSQPRQVNKIEVQYDRTSKQVDVQALKNTLWGHIQVSAHASIQGQEQEEPLSFKQVLASVASGEGGGASMDENSPHLCFICLLHLANEHGLTIKGCTNMDDLTIYLPSSQVNKTATHRKKTNPSA